MKKIIFLTVSCFFMLSTWTTSAQPSEYYHVGDTINGRSPIYYYQWWSEAWLADTSNRLSANRYYPLYYEFVSMDYPATLHGELLQYYFTDTPLKIIGIATSCIITSEHNFSLEWPGELLYPEYLRLYDATEGSFDLLKEVQYDRSTPKRYINLDVREHPDNRVRQQCCYTECPVNSTIADIREYYFDKPITVIDSFYLGYTIENTYSSMNFDMHRDTIDSQWLHIRPLALYWDEEHAIYNFPCDHYCNSTPNHLHKYRTIVWDMLTTSPTYGDTIDSLSIWRWSEDPYYFVEFPIVVIDSSYIIPPYQCPPVTNLRIANQGDGRAVLYWDTHPDQNSFQTCYGSQGTPPESCNRVDCPIQVGTIMGLDSCTHYDAYVRAVCYHDSTCYSDWVGPIDIFICDTTSGGGEGGDDSLRTITALNVLTNIVPNPASMQATVYSSFQINSITVFSSNGQKVFDSPVSGMAATLDLKGWTPGLYIVVIHTPAGNVAKKLVVK